MLIFVYKIFIVIIGLSFVGAGGPVIFILGLVEISKILQHMCENYDQNTINDIASAMFNLFSSIGDLLGPIIGGFISSNFSFKITCIFIFTSFLIFFILFICFYNRGLEKVYEKSSKNNLSLQEELFK